MLGSHAQRFGIIALGLLKPPQVIAVNSQGGKGLAGRHFMLTAAYPLSLILTTDLVGSTRF